jgi:hypothetical protein
LDLGTAAVKADLMAYGEGLTSSFGRQRDDETQNYLVAFFQRAGEQNLGGFNELYGLLNPAEQAKLTEAVASTQGA